MEMPAIARWNGCPRKYEAIYLSGLDLLPLSELLLWEMEQGAHHSGNCHVGASRLFHILFSERGYPELLIKKIQEKERAKK